MKTPYAILSALMLLVPAGVVAMHGPEAHADLVVGDLEAHPADPQHGATTTFNATISNIGDADAENVTVTFLVDGEQVGENLTLQTLGAGNSTTVTSANWTAAEGEHTVTVLVDAQDTVPESSEDNNEASTTVTVAPEPRPNVHPTEPVATPASPTAGQNVTFNTTVANNGTANATNVTVTFLVDGSQLGETTTLAQLAAGDQVNVTSPTWNATEGEHTVTVAVNATEAPEEYDGDNEASATVTVEGPPRANLLVEALEANRTEPSPGQNVTFEATIANEGELDAGNVTVRFLIDGEQLGDNLTLETLGAGNSTVLTSTPWNATEGEHTVTVQVDTHGNVTESDEVDNEATLAFTVASDEDDGTEDSDGADEDEGNATEDQEAEKITICHVPPGNPSNAHTLTIGEPAWGAHEAHGDTQGACEEDAGNQTAEPEEADQADDQEDRDLRRGPPEHAPAHGRD